jgi:hypothetical protein
MIEYEISGSHGGMKMKALWDIALCGLKSRSTSMILHSTTSHKALIFNDRIINELARILK